MSIGTRLLHGSLASAQTPVDVDAIRRIRIYFLSMACALFASCGIDLVASLHDLTPLGGALLHNIVLGGVALGGSLYGDRCDLRTLTRWALIFHITVVLNLSHHLPGDGGLIFEGPKLTSYGQLWVSLLVILFAMLVRLSPFVHTLLALVLVNSSWLWQGLHWLFDARLMSTAALEERTLHGLLVTLLAGIASHASSTLVAEIERAKAKVAELGSWILEREIGSGGMGVVWAARHRMLATPAAVKLIRPAENSPEVQRRFEREAMATASLRSCHTVRLFDYGISKDGIFYYVMEHIEGVDLDSLVLRNGPQAPGRVVHLLRQVCLSLAEAHEAGLIHRDIKPANILCSRNGTTVDFVKVLDFGLVAIHDQDKHSSKRLTAQHEVCGTPEFMSPEHAQALPTDSRSDIYSLGCVAYWLLTGTPPFSNGPALDIMIAQVNDDPPPLDEACPAPIPAGLSAIIHRCLAKDPALRPQSCLDLELALRALPLLWTPEHSKQSYPWRQPAKGHKQVARPTRLLSRSA